jgi:hypothetical protein
MPLLIEDGYTLPFTTDAVVLSAGGTVLYDGLPVVAGLYRPPVWEDRQRHVFRLTRAATPDEEVAAIAEFIAARLVSWDVKILADGLRPAPTDAATLRKLPEPVLNQLYDRVSKWGPKSQGEQAGN